ncbi:Interleukin-4 [Heterocephalus glaber]|uniref:Interleukin-4 n=1 Tax=Heterocephalus glaber TaxID=10181 RepID=G5ASQ0_HETGA|nr:Interleukin-4 [Heterocephalus glaber]
MGLVPQLTVTLFCLLACTGTFVRGCNDALQEIINDLNVLSSQKTPCAELAAADVFAAPKDTAEKLCQAVTVLHRTSYLGVGLSCLNRHRESVFLVLLKKVYRNLRSMVQPNCSVSELKQTTLKDFLENLKTILKKKYSEC